MLLLHHCDGYKSNSKDFFLFLIAMLTQDDCAIRENTKVNTEKSIKRRECPEHVSNGRIKKSQAMQDYFKDSNLNQVFKPQS